MQKRNGENESPLNIPLSIIIDLDYINPFSVSSLSYMFRFSIHDL
jgi:hypothetical protein